MLFHKIIDSKIDFKEKYRIINSSKENLKDLFELINKSYYKPESWTDRKIILLTDERISEEQLKEISKKINVKFFILQDKETNKLVGSIKIEYNMNKFEFRELEDIPYFTIELFCIDPDLQSLGLGKYIFFFAEKIIKLSSYYHQSNI